MKNTILFIFCMMVSTFSLAHEGIHETPSEFCESTFSPESIDGSCCQNILDGCAYIRQTEGRGLGFRKGYTTLGLFLKPDLLFNSCIQPFIDVRAHHFNNGKWAANLGIGGRFQCASGTIYGFNLFYDYLRRHGDYNQIGLGLEMLGCRYDLRLNGYIPVGNTSHIVSHAKFSFPGGFFGSCKQRRKALAGFDAELGTSLNRWLCSPNPCFDVFVGIGPYYYGASCKCGCGDHLFGGRLRIGVYGRNVSFELRTTYDHVFHGAIQGYLGFTFPFNSCDECPCLPIQRQEIIVLGKKSCEWEQNWEETFERCKH